MKPISINKHEWIFANMVPISTTKQKWTFWETWLFIISVLFSWVPNNRLFTYYSYKNRILRWWNLDKFRKPENLKRRRAGHLKFLKHKQIQLSRFWKTMGHLFLLNNLEISWVQTIGFLIILEIQRFPCKGIPTRPRWSRANERALKRQGWPGTHYASFWTRYSLASVHFQPAS